MRVKKGYSRSLKKKFSFQFRKNLGNLTSLKMILEVPKMKFFEKNEIYKKMYLHDWSSLEHSLVVKVFMISPTVIYDRKWNLWRVFRLDTTLADCCFAILRVMIGQLLISSIF